MAKPFRIGLELNVQNITGLKPALDRMQKDLRGSGGAIQLNTAGAQRGLRQYQSGLQATQATMRGLQSQVSATNTTLQATIGLTRESANVFSAFSAQAGLALRRFVAFTAAAGGMVRVVSSIRDAVKEAIAFDLAMNKLAQVSGDAGSRIAEVRGEITRLSTSLGVSSSKLSDVAVTLKQAGLAATSLRHALDAVALTDLAPNFESMEETTEGLIASWKQFNLQANQFKAALGSMNAVAGEFAVEAGDLVTAVQKAGGAFAALAGQSKPGLEALAEFQALFTSVRATTRESADTIATGLRTVFTRLQRSDTVTALKDLGIELRYTQREAKQLGDLSLESQFVGAYEAVYRLAQGLRSLRTTDPRFSQVVEQLGGYRQISKVIPLLQQFGTAQEAVAVATAGQISLQIAAEKRQETLTAKTAKLKEEYLALARELVQTDGFQALANSLLKVADGFASVLQYAAPLLPVLAAFAASRIFANVGNIARNFGSHLVAPPGQHAAAGAGSGRRFASGGPVPGTGYTDTVPALLTPGEFVLRKESAARIGAAKLNHMNRTGKLDGYNQGGFVRMNQGGGLSRLLGKAKKIDTNVGGAFSAEFETTKKVEQVMGEAIFELADLQNDLKLMGEIKQEAERLKIALSNATQVVLELTQAGRSFKGIRQVAQEQSQTDDVKITGIGKKKFDLSPEKLRLVEENAGVVEKVISELKSKPGGDFIKQLGDDARTVGGVALANAARTYDPNNPKKASLASYAYKGIKKAIIRESNRVFGQGGSKVAQSIDAGQESDDGTKALIAQVADTRSLAPGQEAEAAKFTAASSAAVAAQQASQSNLLKKILGRETVPDLGKYEELKEVASSYQIPIKGTKEEIQQKVLAAIQKDVAEYEKIGKTPDDRSKEAADVIAKTVQERNAKNAKLTADEYAKSLRLRLETWANGPRSAAKVVADFPVDKLPQGLLNRILVENEAKYPGLIQNLPKGLRQQVNQDRAKARAVRESQDERRRQEAVARQNALYDANPELQYQDQVLAAGAPGRLAEAMRLNPAIVRGLRKKGLLDQYLADPNFLPATQTFTPNGDQTRDIDRRIAGRHPGAYARAARYGERFKQGTVSPYATDEVAIQDYLLRRVGRDNLPSVDARRTAQAINLVNYKRQQRRLQNQPSTPYEIRDRLQGQLFGAGDTAQAARILSSSAIEGLAPGMLARLVLQNRRNFPGLVDSLGADARSRFEQERGRGRDAGQRSRLINDMIAAGRRASGRSQTREIQEANRDRSRNLPNRLATRLRSGYGIDPNDPAFALRLRSELLQRVASGQLSPDDALNQAASSRSFSSKQMATFRRQLDTARGPLSEYAARRGEDGSLLRDSRGSFATSVLGRRVQRDYEERLRNELPRTNKGEVYGDISNETKGRLEQEAIAKQTNDVRRELLSAERNLLKKLYPSLTVAERRRIAEENVAAAMEGQAKIVTATNGALLGTQKTVEAGKNRGVAATGAGGFLYKAAGIRDKALALPSKFGAGLQRLNQSSIGRALGNFEGAGLATALILPYITSGVESLGGSAATGGNRYRGARGASGFLQGALAGGVAGSVGGPIAAAVGAVVGGGFGLVSALRDAEKEIRTVRIDRALTNFADKISTISNVGPGLASFSASQSARLNIEQYRRETEAKNRAEATGILSGFDSSAFNDLQSQSLRQDFGGQLAQMTQALQREAARLGELNLADSADTLSERLYEGGNGLNRELLSIIADIRNVSIDEVLGELRKTIVASQEATKRDQENSSVQREIDLSASSLARLVLAVQQSADALSDLQGRSQLLADAFEGAISGAKVNFGSGSLNQFGRLDQGALNPLGIVAAYGGSSGSQLRSNAQVVDTAFRELPSILNNAISNAPLDPNREFVAEITNELRSRLGKGQESDRILATVTTQLNDLSKDGPGDLIAKVSSGTSSFVAELLRDIATPIQDAGKEFVSQIEAASNEFVDGVAVAASQMRQVGELRDQLASLRSSNRQNVFLGASGLRRNQASSLIPLGEIESGFNAQQRRLAGPNAFNPFAIGSQLRSTISLINEARQRQQRAAAGDSSLSPEENAKRFRNATEELFRLQSGAASLQQALRNLADVSERNAAIQEKLSQLQQEREGRLGLAERYALAEPDEFRELERGFALANKANNQGSLEGFSFDDRKLILNALSAAGSATLTGFNGAPRADDLRNSLLSSVFGGAFRLNARQRAEEQGLLATAEGRGKIGEQALEQLASVQGEISRDFFASLSATHEAFFSRLAANLEQADRFNRADREGAASARLSDLQRQADQQDLLKSLGVTDATRFGALRESQDTIRDYASSIRQLNAQEKVIQSAFDATRPNFKDFGNTFNDIGRFPGFQDAVQQNLALAKTFLSGRRNIGVDERDAIYDRFKELIGLAGPSGFGTNSEDTSEHFQRIFNSAISDVLRGKGSLYAQSLTSISQSESSLSDQGFNVDAIRQLASSAEGLKKLDEAIAAFPDAQTWNGLEQAIREAEKALRDLSASATSKAMGGSIFSPRGTDTVPAMLTPGEYVVNRQSAAANSSLLRRINAAKGPLYLAGGGGVDTRKYDLLINSIGAIPGFLPAADTLEEVAHQVPGAIEGGVRGINVAGAGIPEQIYQQVRKERNTPAAKSTEELTAGLGDKNRGYAARLLRNTNFNYETTVTEEQKKLYAAEAAAQEQTRKERIQSEEAAKDRRIRGLVELKNAYSALHNKVPIESRSNLRGLYSNKHGEVLIAPPQDLSYRGLFESRKRGLYTFTGPKSRDPFAPRPLPTPTPTPATASAPPSQSRAIVPDPRTAPVRAPVVPDDVVSRSKQRRDALRERRGILSLEERRKRLGRTSYDSRYARRELSDEEKDERREQAYRLARQRALGGLGFGKSGEAASSEFAKRREASLARTQAAAQRVRENEQAEREEREQARKAATAEFARRKEAALKRFASGGYVPGHGNSDTVRALLTPGEYVLNQDAVRRAGVGNLHRLNQGGVVGSAGAPKPQANQEAMNQLAATMNQFVQSIGGFGQIAQQMSQALTTFSSQATALAEALNSMPRSLSIQGQHQVNVNVNGAEVLTKLAPEIQRMITAEVTTAMGRIFREQLPDAGVQV